MHNHHSSCKPVLKAGWLGELAFIYTYICFNRKTRKSGLLEEFAETQVMNI